MRNKMESGYYKADTDNGVYFLSKFDDDYDLVSPRMFYNRLGNLNDGESLICYLHKNGRMIYKIDEEYGVKN
jgi:hypothetical protein